MLTKALENVVAVHTNKQSISRNNLENVFMRSNYINMLSIYKASLYQKI